MSEHLIPSNEPPRRSGGVLRGILTFLLVVLIFFAIGVGVYYGLPYVQSRVIQPIQENTREIQSIQSQQEEASRSNTTRLGDLQSQIDTLNVQQDRDKEALADLRARLEGAEGWKNADKILTNRLDTLIDRLVAQETASKDLQESLTKREKENQNQDTEIASLKVALTEQAKPLAELQGEAVRIQTLERLSRCRAFLAEGNYGDARDALQEAGAFLAKRRGSLESAQVKNVDAVQERFDLALGNLPNAPQLAEKDLGIAWELLMQVEPQTQEVQTPTPRPSVTPPPEATPSPTTTL